MSAQQAVHDLLSDLRKDSGGWNPNGDQPSIQGKMENGTRVITYTFDASPFKDQEGSLSGHARFAQAERAALQQVLSEIEKHINVKFRCVGHADSADQADIRFCRGNFVNPPHLNGKKIGGTTLPENHIIISSHFSPPEFDNGKYGYNTIAHETLHALGLSHPGSNGRGGQDGGNDPRYNKDTTVMSYNPSPKACSDPQANPMLGLRQFDIAALQYIYGPSQETWRLDRRSSSSEAGSGLPLSPQSRSSANNNRR